MLPDSLQHLIPANRIESIPEVQLQDSLPRAEIMQVEPCSMLPGRRLRNCGDRASWRPTGPRTPRFTSSFSFYSMATAQRTALPHPLYSIYIIHSRILCRGIRILLYVLRILIIECECKAVNKHTSTPMNQSSSSSCTPMLLLCTDVAHKDHLSHAPHKGLYYACTVQLLGIKTCVNNQ